jgi:hypothetical protein
VKSGIPRIEREGKKAAADCLMLSGTFKNERK